MRYVTDTFVPFFKSVNTGADTKRSAHSRTVDLPCFLIALHTLAKELWSTEVRTQRGVHRQPGERTPLYKRSQLLSWSTQRAGRSVGSVFSVRDGYLRQLALAVFRMLTVRKSDIVEST